MLNYLVFQQFIILKNKILNIIFNLQFFPQVICGNYVKAKAFLKYFEKTYLGYMKTGMEKSPIFPVEMWNHYDNDDFSSLSFSNLRLVFI